MIDQDHLIDLTVAENVFKGQGRRTRFLLALTDRAVQRLPDKGTFTRTANSGDDTQATQRKLDLRNLQVVSPNSI